MKATRKQKAELRQGFEDSLAAYEREREERAARPAAAADPKTSAAHNAFLIVGDIAELVHSVRACAADIDNKHVAAAVKKLRAATTELGNLLAAAQRQPTRREETE